jgi:hypothetical protein
MSGGDTIDRLSGEGGVAGLNKRQRRQTRLPAPVFPAPVFPAPASLPYALQLFHYRGHVLYDRITNPLAGRIFQLEDEQ